MIDVNELLGYGRSVDQDPKPAEWVKALVALERALGDAGAAHPVKTITTRDEIAVDAVLDVAASIGDSCSRALDLVKLHVVRLVDRSASGGFASGHQVARNLGLAIHHHAAPDQLAEVDPVSYASKGDFDPVVDERFAPHALPDAGCIQQLDRARLDDTGAAPAENVLARLSLEDDVRDTFLEEKLSE